MLDRIKNAVPLNFDLAGNPVNWFIVLLMVAIAGLGASLIFHQPNGGN